MAVTESQTGSTATDGTKLQFGSTINTAGNYQFVINVGAMVAGDAIEIYIERKARVADGAAGTVFFSTLAQDQGGLIILESPWIAIPTNGALSVYVHRKAGTDRTYTWAILTQ